MTEAPFLPAFPDTWEDTRATLHAYSHALSAIPRAHAPAHPQWWHVSLKVRPSGLATDPVPLPGGGALELRFDLNRHAAVVETSSGGATTFDLTAGLTGTEFAGQVIAAVAEHGLRREYDRSKFENDDRRSYDPAAATAFWTALVNVNAVFQEHRASLEGASGPVQLWPHGFDLAFEWFGTRVEEYEEDGELKSYPSQLNLGFYPGGEPYFYSNPWPFDEALTNTPLPGEAVWHTEGWQGTMLPYAALQEDADAADKLREFARAVHEAAAPSLTA